MLINIIKEDFSEERNGTYQSLSTLPGIIKV
jgi:hypothetical protein